MMAKQDKKSYDLSEAEQRDLVTLIQQGKALPEKYRFILFEDKREIELVWNGKTREMLLVSGTTVTTPRPNLAAVALARSLLTMIAGRRLSASAASREGTPRWVLPALPALR